jgi:hypothetical protein
MLINTTQDLQTTEPSEERTAFLLAMLNDYVTFDDAEYPEGYDREIQEGDEGYIEPVIRQEWNAGAASAWGFNSREDVGSAYESSLTHGN